MGIEDLYKEIIKFQQAFLHFKQEMNDFRKETRDKINNMNKSLNRNSEILIGIENTLNFYGDMYKINKDGIQSLDNRLKVLETHN